MMYYSTSAIKRISGPPTCRALLALNLAYAGLVVLERVLHRLGIDALHVVWPRVSPSLGDILQAALLLGGLVVGLAALRERRSTVLKLLIAVVAVLLLMQILHPQLHLAPAPAPVVSTAFPALNAAQGQKLLTGTVFWLVLFGLTLLAVASSATPRERRSTEAFLAVLCLIGLAGGLSDYLGTLFNDEFFAAGTVFGLLEEGGELAGASLLFLIMLRFDRP